MPFAPRPLDARYLPELDIDDPLQRRVTAGCSLVYTPDPLAPGRILGCLIESERGLVPLFVLCWTGGAGNEACAPPSTASGGADTPPPFPFPDGDSRQPGGC